MGDQGNYREVSNNFKLFLGFASRSPNSDLDLDLDLAWLGLAGIGYSRPAPEVCARTPLNLVQNLFILDLRIRFYFLFF